MPNARETILLVLTSGGLSHPVECTSRILDNLELEGQSEDGGSEQPPVKTALAHAVARQVVAQLAFVATVRGVVQGDSARTGVVCGFLRVQRVHWRQRTSDSRDDFCCDFSCDFP